MPSRTLTLTPTLRTTLTLTLRATLARISPLEGTLTKHVYLHIQSPKV